eukprot:Rmarinus@m.27233
MQQDLVTISELCADHRAGVIYLGEIPLEFVRKTNLMLEDCWALRRVQAIWVEQVDENFLTIIDQKDPMSATIFPNNLKLAAKMSLQYMEAIYRSDSSEQHELSGPSWSGLASFSGSIGDGTNSTSVDESVPKTDSFSTLCVCPPENSKRLCNCSSSGTAFSSKPLSTWTCNDVCSWLRTLPLGDFADSYIAAFRRMGVDSPYLPLLNHKILKNDFGIGCEFHRIRILDEIESLLNPKETSSPSQDSFGPSSMSLNDLNSARDVLIASEVPPLPRALMKVHPPATSQTEQSPAGAPLLGISRKNAEPPRSPLVATEPVDSSVIQVQSLAAVATNDAVQLPGGLEMPITPLAATMLLSYEDLELGNRVGYGGFGEVFRARFNGKDVAVKRILNTHFCKSLVKELTAEMRYMSSLEHRNIVGYVGWCLVPLCLVSEFCPGGSLWSFLRRRGSNALSTPLIVKLALDIAYAMEYCHSLSEPVVHRDLKSPNVLFDALQTLKVSDIGLCRALASSEALPTCIVGTPEWMAPEICRVEPYSAKVDVFSFSVILWELITLDWPWKDFSSAEIVAAVCSGKRLDFPGTRTTDPTITRLIALARKGWRDRPSDRPSFKDIRITLEDSWREVSRQTGKEDLRSLMGGRTLSSTPIGSPPVAGSGDYTAAFDGSLVDTNNGRIVDASITTNSLGGPGAGAGAGVGTGGSSAGAGGRYAAAAAASDAKVFVPGHACIEGGAEISSSDASVVSSGTTATSDLIATDDSCYNVFADPIGSSVGGSGGAGDGAGAGSCSR